MNGDASPRPWRFAEYPQCPGLADVFDASGSPSGLVAGELKPTDAALIVAAVNGRAALAAVLRDMEEDCEAAWEGTPLRRALAKYAARLREIAGAGETPTGKGVGR
jgi:hypothetical protein